MNAELFLLNISFSDASATVESIEDTIKKLAEDFDHIRDKGDRVSKHESIYEVEIVPGFRLVDLYDISISCPFQKDVKKVLQKIIDRSKNTDWTNQEIIDLIMAQEDENPCNSKEVYGLLALLKVPIEVSEKFVIYDKRNWLEFHRYFLASFPCDEQHFINRCFKCFPNLYFHHRTIDAISNIDGGWRFFTKSIVYHLSKLNDFFPSYLEARDNYQRIQVLQHFGTAHHIDVTPQGNLKDKIKMTFLFKDFEGKDIPVCCEPHMKLHSSDNSGDNTHYTNRIYFHEGSLSIENGKILIGHIGQHITF